MKNSPSLVLKTLSFSTPLGTMVAGADEKALYFLQFADQPAGKWSELHLESETTEPLEIIREEILLYFTGKLKQFSTPLQIIGTPFQRTVWEALRQIPYGETISYAALSTAIGKPTAYRAAAGANGANQFAIIIPCHRVIASDGTLGGYSSGIERKRWLIQHETGRILV